MKNSQVAPNKEENSSELPNVIEYYDIEHEPFFTIENKSGYKYYQVDIKNVDLERLEKIIRACEEVEKASWGAQESFYNYFIERDLLTYIVKDGEVIGFQLLSCWVIDRYVAFGFDETMVLKEHRGHNLGFALCTVSARTLYLIFSKKKNAKFTFLSITPNPGVIQGYFNYRYLFNFFMRNPFNPSDDLMMIHDKFLFRKKLSLVHKDYPFVIKNMFPGSLSPFETKPFSGKLQEMIPEGVDFFERGDAFAFMAIFSKFTCWPGITTMMFRFFGREYIRNEHLGLFKNSGKITLPGM